MIAAHMGNPFVHLDLTTGDVAAAKKFYGAIFDWQFEDFPAMNWTGIRVGDGVGGGLGPKQTPEQATAWTACVGVDSVDKTVAKAAAAGIETFLFNGTQAGTVSALSRGALLGTRFRPAQNRLAARKYWLRNVPVEAGAIVVDPGAANAMSQKGASLLPGGITAVNGGFRRGDMVEVHAPDGQPIAKGVSQYAAGDIARIAGRHTRDIHTVLGFHYGHSVIHRDDLVLL